MTEFITRSYGNKEFEVIIKTDSKEHYKATEDFARRLIDHNKPLTLADRIRSMTDDELAHELALIAKWDRKQFNKAVSIGLEKVVLDILQQRVEGE